MAHKKLSLKIPIKLEVFEEKSVIYEEKEVMKIYENLTNKKAIQDGNLTEGFKRFCPKYKGSKYRIIETPLCEDCGIEMKEIHNNLNSNCCMNDIYYRTWFCRVCGMGLTECEKLPYHII